MLCRFIQNHLACILYAYLQRGARRMQHDSESLSLQQLLEAELYPARSTARVDDELFQGVRASISLPISCALPDQLPRQNSLADFVKEPMECTLANVDRENGHEAESSKLRDAPLSADIVLHQWQGMELVDHLFSHSHPNLPKSCDKKEFDISDLQKVCEASLYLLY